MVDYRSSSYKRIARSSRIRGSLERQRDAQEAAGISNRLGDRFHSGGSSGSSSSSSNSDTQVVQTSESVPSQRAADVFQGKMSTADFLSGKPATTQTVTTSPAFAGKLAGQSLRDDSGSYRVQTELRNRQVESVDYSKKFENDFIGPKYEEKKSGGLKGGYENSPAKRFVTGVNYLLSTRKDRVERDFKGNPIYSDNPETQKEIDKRVAKEEEGRAAAGDVLIFGGSVATLEPVGFGKNKAVVAGKTTTKVLSTSEKSIATSVSYGEGYVERRLAGFKILPNKPVTFAGRSKQITTDSGFVGGVSKEPILKTSGESRFNVFFGRQKTRVTSSSEGLQVGELGQRKNVLVMSTANDAKQLRVGTSVDTFVTKQTNDAVYGGVVSNGGVQVFSNKKILETDTAFRKSFLTARYVDEGTGLDYAGPNFQGKTLFVSENVKDVPVTTRIFEGGSVGQPQIPLSAFGTKRGAIKTLRQEVSGKSSTSFNPVFKTATGSDLVSKKSFSYDGMVLDPQVKAVIESRPVLKTRIGSPSPDSLIVQTKRESQSVNTPTSSNAMTNFTSLKPRLVYADDAVDIIPKSNLINKGNVRDYASIKSIGSLGVGSSSLGRSGSGLRSDNTIRQSLVPRVEALPKITPISGQRPSSVSRVNQINPPTYSFKPNSILRPGISVITPPPIVPVAGFGFMPRGNTGKFTVELRRFGKFSTVGYGRTLAEANRIGALQARKTLGVTYRIKSNTGFVSVAPGLGFYKKGFNIIERNKFRLNTGNEVGEINFFKKRGRGLKVYE